MMVTLAFMLAAVPVPAAEKLRNDKVVGMEFTLKPGEEVQVEGQHPAITVYFNSGTLEFTPGGGHVDNVSVRLGEVVFTPAQAGKIRNPGTSALKFVRTEFLTEGSSQTWGAAGLSPNYKLLIENQYTRVYDIKIPAGTSEPQHTHKARVVVCLSGATLKHLMPDGREEPSTLKTGEVAWRPGGTHIGQNLGATDLWVIAIEPK
jgi:quercetin dioxygenase-like cupin family protein